jgi:putative restriction endonuclease
MAYWWVNQNQTYKFEVHGGFLWSPKTRKDGGYNYFYETMSQVQPGDIVFSYCDTLIKAIGIVQSPAVTAPKPDFRNAGSNWSEIGWYVEVEFSELTNPFRPREMMQQIIPHLSEKYAPLRLIGKGNQGVYLTEISSELASILTKAAQVDIESICEELSPISEIEIEFQINLEIESKGIQGDLEKIQLVKARRGQGIFKANVRQIEDHCRVTGVKNIKHLRASHIKPWSKSNDLEKLSGFNGLLLAPHVDHLFDKGFITFQSKGEMVLSPNLNTEILDKWSIPQVLNVGSFTSEQSEYLNYHQESVFLAS